MTGRHLVILGTHGIPARHGGFETCAEKLALFMRDQGWRVTVYSLGTEAVTAEWHGITCVTIKKHTSGLMRYLGPLLYDLTAVWHARKQDAVFLTMGYNTALFNLILKFYRRPQIINMDGLEWQRTKYKRAHEKIWLRVNEYAAVKIADVCIADHPVMADYLRRQNPRDLVTIAYGADAVEVDAVSATALNDHHLQPGRYGLVIARPEPENQILEIVSAWTASDHPDPLVVLGHYRPDHPYHCAVSEAAGPATVNALRFHAGVYVHGHTVGGTNPSLVEALAAGCAIIAHDNPFNRGVAADAALYFTDRTTLIEWIGTVSQRADLKQKARDRHAAHYQWPPILRHYQTVIEKSRGS